MASFKLFAVMAILALAGSAAAARKRVTKKDVGFPSVADALIAGNYTALLDAVQVRRGPLSPRRRLKLGVARRSAGSCPRPHVCTQQLTGCWQLLQLCQCLPAVAVAMASLMSRRGRQPRMLPCVNPPFKPSSLNTCPPSPSLLAAC